MLDLFITNAINITKLILTAVGILVSTAVIVGVIVRSYRQNPAIGIIYGKFVVGLLLIIIVWKFKQIGADLSSLAFMITAICGICLAILTVITSGDRFASDKRAKSQAINLALFVLGVLLMVVSTKAAWYFAQLVFP